MLAGADVRPGAARDAPPPLQASATVHAAVRCVRASVATTARPWMPDAACLAALGTLPTAMRSEREAVLAELAEWLLALDMPPQLDTPDAALMLYRALCAARCVSFCLAYEWRSHQRADALDSGAWSDPPALAAGAVQLMLGALAPMWEHLAQYERAALLMYQSQHTQLSPDGDRRALSFRWRDTDQAQRERDVFYALMDAELDVYVSSAAPYQGFVLFPELPMRHPALELRASGAVLVPAAWHTPADALDAPPRTMAAHLSRALAPIMMYCSAAHWEATRRALGRLTDLRADLRPWEYVYWRAPRLTGFLRDAALAVPNADKRALGYLATTLRRVLHAWTHYVPSERGLLMQGAALELVAQLSEALQARNETPRRRQQLWPALAALTALQAPLGRARRELALKRTSLLDALHAHVPHARLGRAASWALVVWHSITSYAPSPPPPPAATRALGTRLLDAATVAHGATARLPAQLLVALARGGAVDEAVAMVRMCLYERPSHVGTFVVAQALVALLPSDGAWRAALAPLWTPGLRHALRGIVRGWLQSGGVSDAAVTTLYAVLHVALLDPAAFLAPLPHERAPQSPGAPAARAAALLPDTRAAVALALLAVPESAAALHAAALGVLTRLLGAPPAPLLLTRFAYVPPALAAGPTEPQLGAALQRTMLAPHDAAAAAAAARHALHAPTLLAQWYWLTALEAAAERAARSGAALPPGEVSAAVATGLGLPSPVVVRAAQAAARALAPLVPLPPLVQALDARGVTVERVCTALAATSAPSAPLAAAWDAWLRWWERLAAPGDVAAHRAELMALAHVLAAGRALGLHGVSCTLDTPLIRAAAQLFVSPGADAELVEALLDAVPPAALPLVLQRAVDAAGRTSCAESTWLHMLARLVPRLAADALDGGMWDGLVRVTLACVAQPLDVAARRDVCHAAALLARAARDGFDDARAELLDAILDWALLEPPVRRDALSAVLALSAPWPRTVQRLSLRVSMTDDAAREQFVARAVDRLLRIACAEPDMDLDMDMVAAPDAPAALVAQALGQVLAQHPSFVAHHAVRLMASSEPLARRALLLALAPMLASPTFQRAEQAHAAQPAHTTAELLMARDGQWLVDVLSRSTSAAAAAWEAALAGYLSPAQWAALLTALVQAEVAHAPTDAMLLRTNTATLAFLLAYVRRIAYVHIHAVVRDMLDYLAQLDESGLDVHFAQGSGAAPSARQHDAAQRLIAALATSLVAFVHTMPAELHHVCMELYGAAHARFDEAAASRTLGVLLCLRVLGPAVASPPSVGLAPPPADRAHALSFLSKVLVALPQGLFSAHRDVAYTALNPVVATTTSFLARVWRVAVERRRDEPPSGLLQTDTPPAFAAGLRECLAPLADAGDAVAHDALASMAPVLSYTQRVRLALDAQDRAAAFDAFVHASAQRAGADVSDWVYEVQGAARRTVCIVYARFEHRTMDLAAVAGTVLRRLGAMADAWDLLLDLTGVVAHHLHLLQLCVVVAQLLPPPASRLLHSVIVVHEGYAEQRYLWLPGIAPGTNAFCARRAKEGGPPLRVHHMSAAADYAQLDKHVRTSLPPATQHVMALLPTYTAEHLTLDDGRHFPVPATVAVAAPYLIVRTCPPTEHETPRTPTCDVIPLSDVVLESDHVSAIRVRHRPSGTELYLRMRDMAPTLHALLRAQMASGAPSDAVCRPVALTQVRAAAAGFALLHRTSPCALLRAAAESLLCALGLAPSPPWPAYTPSPRRALALPVAWQPGVLATALDLPACLGQQHGVGPPGLGALLPAVPPADLPRTMQALLTLWRTHVHVRPALQEVWASLATQPAAVVDHFVEACVDAASHAPSMVLHAVQDVILAAALPDLQRTLLDLALGLLCAPPRPGVWPRLHALVALHAVQCLVPATPLAALLPHVVALVLLLAEPGVSPPIQRAVHVTLVHTLAAWPAPHWVAPANALFDTPDDVPLDRAIALWRDMARDLAASPAQERAWHAALQEPLYTLATARDGLVQPRALDVLAHIAPPTPDTMRAVGRALLAAFPHATPTVTAAAACWAQLCTPAWAPSLFWAGTALVASGAMAGGLRLMEAAAASLDDARAWAQLMDVRRADADVASALERELGVSFELNFSLACATVLRAPLWSDAPEHRAAARQLAQRLTAWSCPAPAPRAAPAISTAAAPLAPPADSRAAPPPDGTSLEMLALADTESSPARRMSLPDSENEVGSLSASQTSLALADPLLPHANDSQMQGLWSLLAESDWHMASGAAPPIRAHWGATPMEQLRLARRSTVLSAAVPVRECGAWLEAMVADEARWRAHAVPL